MNKGIFITGTDTGVGKTFVSIGLLQAFKEMGFSVCPMKPVETGCRINGGKLIPLDTLKLMDASGVKEPIEVVNPYRFKPSLAPAVAAELEEAVIKRSRIISSYKKLSNKYDITIVEGAGGIMVPVYKRYLYLELIKDLDIPVIIVSRPGLGTINHTLLTIRTAQSRGIKILGVIINYAAKIKKSLSEKTNPEVIEQLGGAPVLGIVPYFKNPTIARNKKIFSEIAKKIIPCF